MIQDNPNQNQQLIAISVDSRFLNAVNKVGGKKRIHFKGGSAKIAKVSALARYVKGKGRPIITS